MTCFHNSDEACYCDEDPVIDGCHFCGRPMPKGPAGSIPDEGDACSLCWEEFKAEGMVA